VVTAIRTNQLSDIEWGFLAFSLDQIHVAEGEPAVWERPEGERGSGVLALEWGLAVRDAFPDQFLDAHWALFAARHDHAKKLHLEEVVREAVASAGLDPDAVAEEVASGRPLHTLAKEHTEAVDDYGTFGVPTFIEGDDAAFIRFMERNRVDDLERSLEWLSWSRLNEFKRPRLPR
jgi:hypothetical protein